MSNLQRQLEELEVLKSIYYPEEFTIIENDSACSSQTKGIFYASVTLPSDDYKVRFVATHDDTPRFMTVSFLPPIILKFTLPPEYPVGKAPSIFLTCPWLTKGRLYYLKKLLLKKWVETRAEIIYTWFEWLKSETLGICGFGKELNLIPLCHEYFKILKSKSHRQQKRMLPSTILETYNREMKIQELNKATIECTICFTQKQGIYCSRFQPCDHTYCKECLISYFSTLINEGNVRNIKCPQIKCNSEATQSMIRDLVPTELFERYEKLLLSRTLDMMADVVLCPLPACGYAVIRETDDKLAHCPFCLYAFCFFCRRGYHGIEPCRIIESERRELVHKYQNGDDQSKHYLELRYGKKHLNDLVELSLSEDYIKEKGKNCPNCKVVIEKSEGCNKIACSKCQCFFCWLCQSVLDRDNPYYHFRDPTSPCNNKLFNFEEGEDDWEDAAFFDNEDSGESDLEGLDSDD